MHTIAISLIVISLLSASYLEASDVRKLQVVTQSITVDEKESGVKMDFVAAQVVEVIEHSETMALVREPWVGEASGWIPRNMLVTVNDFQQITSWSGVKTFTWSSESYDSAITYHVNSNGTFKADFDDRYEPRTWLGRLHQKGDLLWAKPDNPQHQYFESTSVFKLTPEGVPCFITLEKSCYYDPPIEMNQ